MKNVVVIGKGKSGKSAKNLLEIKGYNVCFITTDDPLPNQKFDFAVISPGISLENPFVKNLSTTIEIISEVELAFRFTKGKIIAVTGTNGKSSLVTYLGYMFSSKICGNIGIPACDVLPFLKEDEWGVLELSSFQLELTYTKKIDISILLEVTEDHLDRYESFEAYRAVKYRIKSLTTKNGNFFMEAESDEPSGKYFSGSIMKILKEIEKKTVGSIKRADELFSPLPHRMEVVCKRDGITFINDSKSTNLASTVFAVKKLEGNIILLVGGSDEKGSDFSYWNDAFKKEIKAIVCFGSAGETIKKSLRSNFLVYTVNKMEEAIIKGLSLVSKGDTILLSPGCPSYDAFLGFDERGDIFKKEVMR